MSLRTTSTEADALRFLNSADPTLPIPRLIDSFVMRGRTYTIMNKLPGELFIHALMRMSKVEIDVVCEEVLEVLKKLWQFKQPADAAGKVMMSASGHGVPDPLYFHEEHSGPFTSQLSCYIHISGAHTINSFLSDFLESDREAVVNDSIVWVHPDLRTYNVVVKDGHLSGIIDWEDSGWYPVHWQVFALRWLCPGCLGPWIEFWERYKFPEESEAAYKACRTVLTYPL